MRVKLKRLVHYDPCLIEMTCIPRKLGYKEKLCFQILNSKKRKRLIYNNNLRVTAGTGDSFANVRPT